MKLTSEVQKKSMIEITIKKIQVSHNVINIKKSKIPTIKNNIK